MRSSKNHALCATGPFPQSGPGSSAADATPEGLAPAHRTQSTIFLPRVPQPTVPGLTQFLMETSPAGTLRTVMKALPSKEVTNILWDFYYNEYTWACEYECKVEAQREYADFWRWIESGGSIDLIDPAWLAFLFCKVSKKLKSLPDADRCDASACFRVSLYLISIQAILLIFHNIEQEQLRRKCMNVPLAISH